MELDGAIKILKSYRSGLNGVCGEVMTIGNVEKALGVVLGKYEEEASSKTQQAGKLRIEGGGLYSFC